MAFWSSTTLDPKRQFKFSITFGRLGTDATFLAQSADRPQFKVSDGTKVDFLDKSFHFPGKVTWEPVKIKFVDAASGGVNATQDAYRFLVSAGWVSPSLVVQGRPTGDSFKTISKFTANNQVKGAGGEVTIRTLNANGGAVDTWTLNNAFITAVVLNNLDYAAENILTAEYTFRYDWASLAPF